LVFDTRKNKKEKNESSLSFQQRRAVKLLKLRGKPRGLSFFDVKKSYISETKALSDKYSPQNWLSKNCENASSVSFATHVIKLTHSSIDSSSLLDCIHDYKNAFLTTSALKTKKIDGAVKGNQFAPIFQFLELELNGIKLAEQLVKDNQIFAYFVRKDEDIELQEKWITGFRKALDAGKMSTHALAKQIYFPLETEKYHLLCNLISSSMAHSIHEKVFDEQQKPIKKQVEKNKYSEDINIRFVKRSHLGVTASNHSNASQLNAKRVGRLHLFSSAPPTWQSQIKPPSNRKDLFDDFYNFTIKTEIDYLRDFLLRFNRLGLSINDPKRKRHLQRWVDNIIDEFLFYVSSIQNLPSGWSADEKVRLKKEHQYLLDPYRVDEAFQKSKQASDWQTVIRSDFAKWMNRQLRGKDKQFTPQSEHTRLWKKLLEQPLREYMEPIEQEIKQGMGETA